MASSSGSISPFEKQQMRHQIQSEIEEFLKRGGEICVLDEPGKQDKAKRASVWHGQEDIHQLID